MRGRNKRRRKKRGGGGKKEKEERGRTDREGRVARAEESLEPGRDLDDSALLGKEVKSPPRRRVWSVSRTMRTKY